jgi:voltage-gated potassium channel
MIRDAAISLVMLLAATLAFYLVPVGDIQVDEEWILAIALLVGLAVVAATVAWQVRTYRRDIRSGAARLRGLLVAIYITVLYFALTYFVLTTAHPDQMDGLRTRTDALYFSFTVVSTVGFGDVHAAGQAGRVIVTLQMAFNWVFITLAIAAVRDAGPPSRRT